MKAAFSNIGWSRHDDSDVLDALRIAGVTGIEVAPTKVWPEWIGATETNARAYRATLASAGFEVPALQAVAFGKPLQLFDPTSQGRRAFLDHFATVADIAAGLGASAVVYGAPKTRVRGELSDADASSIAEGVFRALGATFAARGVCLCIEPNPTEYGCDFITNAAQAKALVDRVAHPGFGLHLDAAALHMAAEPLASMLPSALSLVRHFHISEPFLNGFENSSPPHLRNLELLARSGYQRWVSVEVDEKKHDMTHTLRFLSSMLEEIDRGRT